MKMSKFLTLNQYDFVKGMIVASATSSLQVVYQTLDGGTMDIAWKQVGVTALCSSVGYILKNLITNSNGQIAKAEQS
jgi:hypothetical protein